MKPFRFALQRILEFRAARVEEEERKLAAIQQQFAALDQEIRGKEESRRHSSRSLATAEASCGEELRALMRFCSRLDREKAELEGKKSVCAQQLAQQNRNCTRARREHRLLETLRERQLAEWTREAGREMDRVAGELHLARWKADLPGNDSRAKGRPGNR
jgi:flagellar export protein FliJ